MYGLELFHAWDAAMPNAKFYTFFSWQLHRDSVDHTAIRKLNGWLELFRHSSKKMVKTAKL